MPRSAHRDAADLVVSYLWSRIEGGALKPGDRLSPERELAVQVGVSRSSVRTALQRLGALGVIDSRQGSGTYIAEGPPLLDSRPLRLLATLHRIGRQEWLETRLLLEIESVALAAQRATSGQLTAMAEELVGMFASTDDPQTFLSHDIRFHRAIAEASGNPMLAALVDMVAGLFFEERKEAAGREPDLKTSAAVHRRIFEAVRDRDPQRARAEMDEHLRHSWMATIDEAAGQEVSATAASEEASAVVVQSSGEKEEA